MCCLMFGGPFVGKRRQLNGAYLRHSYEDLRGSQGGAHPRANSASNAAHDSDLPHVTPDPVNPYVDPSDGSKPFSPNYDPYHPSDNMPIVGPGNKEKKKKEKKHFKKKKETKWQKVKRVVENVIDIPGQFLGFSDRNDGKYSITNLNPFHHRWSVRSGGRHW